MCKTNNDKSCWHLYQNSRIPPQNSTSYILFFSITSINLPPFSSLHHGMKPRFYPLYLLILINLLLLFIIFKFLFKIVEVKRTRRIFWFEILSSENEVTGFWLNLRKTYLQTVSLKISFSYLNSDLRQKDCVYLEYFEWRESNPLS